MSQRRAAPSWRPPVLLAVAVLLGLGLSAAVVQTVPDVRRWLPGGPVPAVTVAPATASGPSAGAAGPESAPVRPGAGSVQGIVVEGERSREDVLPDVDVAPAPAPSPTVEGDDGQVSGDDLDAAGSGGAPSPSGDAAEVAAARVLELVNTERADAGCGPLRQDPELDALATAHSRDMRARDYFDHTDPDGLTPWDRADAAGVSGLAAENIARGQPDADAVVAAWMNSPGHRANILECSHTRHGLGMVAGAGGPWWTQHFGR